MGAGCCGGGGHDGPVAKPAFNEEQESVAKWIRWYVKTKNAPVKGGEKVDWFTGQGKIVDPEVSSGWGYADNNILFSCC